jgi:hypothetical protein
MTLFALLHGGLHRGSSWDLVGAELRERGHRVVQPDIPVDEETAGAREWAQCAIDAIDTLTRDETDVVVVGHSIAGLCLPVLAANRPVRRMVFLAALIPAPGRSFADHLAEHPDAINFSSFVTTTSGEGGPFGLTWESVREGFYHDCPEQLARKAFEALRGQAFTVFIEKCPIDRWPNTPSSYIVMADDRTLRPEWARRAAAGLPLVAIHTLRGGHSPFFAQPKVLSELLIACCDDTQ